MLGYFMKAAENGWLPDVLIRVGIRNLLRNRLRENASHVSPNYEQEFVRATQAQPIAVSTDKANDQHYEVPAEFFTKVLGKRRKYSSCYWARDTKTLDQAEEKALRRTCENAGLENGMSILELGCGWGSLSLWMAEKFPASQITAVSNSNSQRQYIESQANSAGVSNLTVVTADVNDFEPGQKFDRVVSVEMFEHVRNHLQLMNRINSWLLPGGKLLVHIFCHKDTPYLFRTDGEQNWMGRHFFSGGMMPSVNLLDNCKSKMNLADTWQWNGMHYARTCREWIRNQDGNRREVLEVLANTYGVGNKIVWENRWRMFFMACEELFAFNKGEEWFVSHYLFERSIGEMR